jgi:hypothetical protein
MKRNAPGGAQKVISIAFDGIGFGVLFIHRDAMVKRR